MAQDQNLAGIQEVINRFVSLFGVDNSGIVAMFTQDAVAVGTGADEVSFGLAEIRSEMDQDTSQIDELSMTLDAPSRISVVGEAGFAYSDVVFAGSAGGQPFQIPARWTLGLIRINSDWMIAQLHFSVPDSQ